MKAPKFQMTNDAITVIHEGKPVIVRQTQPNFFNLRKAIFEQRWSDVPKHLSVSKSLDAWAKGKFKLRDGNTFLYDGVVLPEALNERIVKMAASGADPGPLFKFWEKLQKNPSHRSVEQLFPFLKHQGIPLDEDGDLLAYKSVTSDYRDHHSKLHDNHPGNVLEMPRNKISDDPNQGCHYGFHVGALEYASTFGGQNSRIIICKVNPADVVCIPYDSNFQKMRVCKYEVIGLHNGLPLDSVLHLNDEAHSDELGEFCTECDGSHENGHNCWCPGGEGEGLCDPSCDGDCFAVFDEEELEELPSPAPETTIKRKKSKSKGFKKYDKMGYSELFDVSIDVLRKYASQHLKIIGASKIPGGKSELIRIIMRDRE